MSFGSFGRSPGVVEFFGFVWFIGLHSGSRRVLSCSLRSFGRALVSFGFDAFILPRCESHRVHSGSFGSFGLCSKSYLGRALLVVGFIRERSWDRRVLWDSWVMRAFGVVGFIRFIRVRPEDCRVHSCSFRLGCRRVHLGSFRRVAVSTVSFGFIGFTRARPSGRRGLSGTLGSLGLALGSSGTFGFFRACIGGHLFPLGAFGSFRRTLGIVRCIRVHSGTPWVLSILFVFVWLNQARLWIVAFIWVRWVHSGTSLGCWLHSGLLCSFGRALGVIGFIRFRWVHSGTLLRLLSSCGFVGFIRSPPVGCLVHS